MHVGQFSDTSRAEALKSEIEKLRSCEHVRQEVRYHVASNDTRMYKKQCLRCGQKVGGWIPYRFAPQNPKPMDEDLRSNYEQSVRDLTSALHEELKRDRSENSKAAYREYLASAEWKTNRQLVIDRAKGICEGCLRKPAYTAHHLTYAHIGNEFLFEMVAICRECHDRLHPEAVEGGGDEW